MLEPQGMGQIPFFFNFFLKGTSFILKNKGTIMSKTKIFQDAWNMSNGGQFSDNARAWLMASNVPAYTGNNKYLDTSNENKTDLDYSDAGETAGGVFGSIFGGPLGGAIGSMAGNLIGQGVNYAANKSLQENQVSNQMELQNRAYNLNQTAVQNQAQNEVIGMQKAGLNPAGVNGQGAPSIQAGAAAGANSTMGNIFGGLAELITAIKAPTEIEKLQAEKALTEGQTERTAAETDLTREQKYNLQLDSDLIKPEQAKLIQEQANKLIQDTQNVKNLNDVFKAHQDFVKETGPGIFDSYRATLKASGQYDKLPTRTRATIDSLADGEIDLGIGELQGLKDVIDSQANLSKRDRESLENMLRTVIAIDQLNDPNVLKAMAQAPRQQYDKLVADTAEVWTNIGKLMQETNRTKQAITLDAIETKLKEMENPAYLSVYGTYKEEKAEFDNSNFQAVRDMISGTVRNVLGGYAAGRGIGAGGKTKPLGPTYKSDPGTFFKGGLRGWQEKQAIDPRSPWN